MEEEKTMEEGRPAWHSLMPELWRHILQYGDMKAWIACMHVCSSFRRILLLSSFGPAGLSQHWTLIKPGLASTASYASSIGLFNMSAKDRKKSFGQEKWAGASLRHTIKDKALNRIFPTKNLPEQQVEDDVTPPFEMSNRYYRIALIGAGGIGAKSALIVQLVNNRFLTKLDPTIEDNYVMNFYVDGRPVTADIMDTAGQEEYAALRDSYLAQPEMGYLIGYSLTSGTSFNATTKFRDAALRCQGFTEDPQQAPIVLVGNKKDLVDERIISTAEGEELAHTWQVPFFETSAKTRENVKECIQELVRQIDIKREKYRPSAALYTTGGSVYKGSVDTESGLPEGYGYVHYSKIDNPGYVMYCGFWHKGRKHGKGMLSPRAWEPDHSDQPHLPRPFIVTVLGTWRHGKITTLETT